MLLVRSRVRRWCAVASPGNRGRTICSPVQSSRIRSRFYASHLDTRFGNHGTVDPLVEPLTDERKVKKWNSRTPQLSCPLSPGLWALLLDDLGRITGNPEPMPPDWSV